VICMNNFFERCGLPQNQPVVLVLDRNLRVAGIIADAEAARAAVRAIACLAALPRETPREVTLPAPVLFLPNLIERELVAPLLLAVVDLVERCAVGALRRIAALVISAALEALD
jgi:hypothetical protein